MTKHEWETCGDIDLMFNFVEKIISKRKIEAFIVGGFSKAFVQFQAFVQLQKAFFPNWCDSSINALQMMERRIDGLASFKETQDAWRKISSLQIVNLTKTWLFGFCKAEVNVLSRYGNFYPNEVLREVYNPFINYKLPEITKDLMELAKETYKDRTWKYLAVLADGLEDLGVNQEIIEHFRKEDHCQGCWALDFILNKK